MRGDFVTNIITVRQATMWFILYQLGSAFLILPGALTSVAKQDAWLSIIIALALNIFCIPLYIAIANQCKGKSFDEHLCYLFGKWGGGILLFVFILCYPFFIFITVLRDLSDFLTSVVLNGTPQDAVVLLMVLAVIYLIRSGIAVIGQAVEILFFCVMLLIMICFIPLISSMEMNNILPMFEYGWKSIVLASFTLLSFPYFESVLFLFFLSNIKDRKKWKQIVIKSTFVTSIIFLFVIFVTIGVLSEGVVSNTKYPTYFVVRTIRIGDFLERFEVLIAVLWYILVFFRLSLVLYVSAYGMASAFRLKDHRSLFIPLALIGLIMAKVVWPDATAPFNMLQVWPYYTSIFGIFFPLFIWAVGKMKEWRNPPANQKANV